jgi:hypothetical protein
VLAVVVLVFDNLAVAGLASLLFLVHFYHPNVMRGNQPEEYGAILTVLAVALSLGSVAARGRRSLVLATASGLLFGLTCLAKETFALGIPPWLFLLVWQGTNDRRLAIRRALGFVCGLFVPLLAFLVYLVWNGALGDWVNVVRFNLSYIRFDARNQPNPGLLGLLADGFRRANQLVLGVSRATSAAALLGLASILSASFRRRTHSLSAVLGAFFLLNLVGVSLARRYGYYYLQLVPGYVLLAACGLAFLAFLVRTRRGVDAIAIGFVAVVLVTTNLRESARFVRSVSQPRAFFHGDDELAAFIDANTTPHDRVWNLVRNGSAIYADARRLSPTRFIYIAVNLFRDLPDPDAARREIRDSLDARPPKIVLFDGDVGWLEKAGLEQWFSTHYRRGPVSTVFLRKAAPPEATPPP